MVNKIDTTLSEQQAKVSKLEADVASINQEVYTLKNIVNSHEQDLRSATIRITGFPLTQEEKGARSSADLKKRLFDRLLCPILTVAFNRELQDVRPTIDNSIVSCYRLGAPAAKANSSPPPIVVKLCSSQVRINLLKCKKEAAIVPTIAEKEAGSRAFIISEDLTQPAFKKLKELQNHVDIDRAWSYEGKIQFVLVGSKNIIRASSVFDDVDTIVSKAQAQ